LSEWLFQNRLRSKALSLTWISNLGIDPQLPPFQTGLTYIRMSSPFNYSLHADYLASIMRFLSRKFNNYRTKSDCCGLQKSIFSFG